MRSESLWINPLNARQRRRTSRLRSRRAPLGHHTDRLRYIMEQSPWRRCNLSGEMLVASRLGLHARTHVCAEAGPERDCWALAEA